MTKKETNLIKKRISDLRDGKCDCLELILAKANGVVTDAELQATKRLEIRCPLHVSGACNKCQRSIDKGGIDIFQEARKLGLMQMSIFDHNQATEADH